MSGEYVAGMMVAGAFVFGGSVTPGTFVTGVSEIPGGVAVVSGEDVPGTNVNVTGVSVFGAIVAPGIHTGAAVGVSVVVFVTGTSVGAAEFGIGVGGASVFA